MIFVFGGAFSGKAAYVKNEYGIDEIVPHDAGREAIKNAKAVRDIHLFIKDAMLCGRDPYEAVTELMDNNPDAVLISNEIGGGIVPLDAFEREYRETAGRISCMIMERALSAVRVICGIGIKLK